MITITKELITPQALKQKLPINGRVEAVRGKKLNEIKRILSKEDKRLILIAGPCSADNEEAFYYYLSLLKKLEKEVRGKILLIPRLYTAKPRSRGDYYKGIIYSKDPLIDTVDFEEGLFIARRMFITALSEFEFACADELLHTDTYNYFDDVSAYAVIGARNAESQQHRFLASGLDIPVAFKNPTNGDLASLGNAVYTAQRPNTFIYNGNQAQSFGNKFAHAILRGGVDKQGKHFSNYSIQELTRLKLHFDEAKIENSSIIIDVNHSNSAKNYDAQSEILLDSYAQIKSNPEIRKVFAGYMVESYIKDGACKAGESEFGKSVTDGCLGWEKTESLIHKLMQII